MDPVTSSLKIITEKLHPPIPDEKEFPLLSQIMSKCFEFQAKDRPTFRAIWKTLRNLHVLDDSFVVIQQNIEIS